MITYITNIINYTLSDIIDVLNLYNIYILFTISIIFIIIIHVCFFFIKNYPIYEYTLYGCNENIQDFRTTELIIKKIIFKRSIKKTIIIQYQAALSYFLMYTLPKKYLQSKIFFYFYNDNKNLLVLILRFFYTCLNVFYIVYKISIKNKFKMLLLFLNLFFILYNFLIYNVIILILIFITLLFIYNLIIPGSYMIYSICRNFIIKNY